MIGITKTFPGVVANKDIDFEAYEGEIHGLLGENGAGKSTLMSILAGFYRADKGEIWINGRQVRIRSPKDAIKLGIGMVYQHFSLVRKLTVLENVMLAITTSLLKMPRQSKIADMIEETAKSLGFSIDPYAVVADLSVGEQQRVEIIKILLRGSNIIILDEPTSILSPVEVSGLFDVLKRLARDGKAIVFISHKLEEVMAICDRVTVLRSGRKVGTLTRDEIQSAQRLVTMIFGSELAAEHLEKRKVVHTANEILRVEGLIVENDLGVNAVNGLDLFIREGEILGIAGIEGNGQLELAEALAGLRPVKGGAIYFRGNKLTKINPTLMYSLGVRYITVDRVGEGIIPSFNITENLLLKSHRDSRFMDSWLIPWARAHRIAEQIISEYNIIARGPGSPASTLSGGNLQKLLVAREFMFNPTLIIANQPTHGLDVKTTQYIHKKFIEQVSSGSSALLISNDLAEVIKLSDRIAVIYNGRIVGVFDREKADIETIGKLMIGHGVPAKIQ